ncbi:peptidoglycan DD-metalloendopeptidase family protein [Bacteroides sp. OttesenSCG-928-D19]|nr:peptidoglycan DD-metalloendopeptidase family protein [Bacteroides sp. OttesenSCG-928-D19]
MKRILWIWIACIGSLLTASGQSVVKELQERRGTLLRQIEESESLLNTTKKDVSGQLNALTTLTGQIDERKRYIMQMANDVEVIDREQKALERQLGKLEEELAVYKKNYEASVRHIARNNSVEEKLLFIFSAKSLAQTYRRMRYAQEYASYQRLQGEQIMGKQKEITQKKAQLDATRLEKEKLLREHERENKKLQEQERMQRDIVAQLQKRQRGLQDEITRKRREANQLNARIDKYIAEEIERVRKQTEAEEKRTNATLPKATPMGEFRLNKADRALSGSFAENRGRLPVPVTGPYTIISRYGQYAVQGLRNVKLDNKGIDIQTPPGSEARAVFDGEVSAVFQFQGNNLFNVLVRHGNYISVYCNLTSASVKQGDKVKTKQSLGRIFSDKNDKNRTILHFQLRKERQQLNPEPWLARR